jgi:hypothetical protein
VVPVVRLHQGCVVPASFPLRAALRVAALFFTSWWPMHQTSARKRSATTSLFFSSDVPTDEDEHPAPTQNCLLPTLPGRRDMAIHEQPRARRARCAPGGVDISLSHIPSELEPGPGRGGAANPQPRWFAADPALRLEPNQLGQHWGTRHDSTRDQHAIQMPSNTVPRRAQQPSLGPTCKDANQCPEGVHEPHTTDDPIPTEAASPPVVGNPLPKVVEELLPLANIHRSMTRVLPANAQVSGRAKVLMQEIGSEFIRFLSSEAAYLVHENRKIGHTDKQIKADHVMDACERLGT